MSEGLKIFIVVIVLLLFSGVFGANYIVASEDRTKTGTEKLTDINTRAGEMRELEALGYDVSYMKDAGRPFSTVMREALVNNPSQENVGKVGVNDSSYDKAITSESDLDDLNNFRDSEHKSMILIVSIVAFILTIFSIIVFLIIKYNKEVKSKSKQLKDSKSSSLSQLQFAANSQISNNDHVESHQDSFIMDEIERVKQENLIRLKVKQGFDEAVQSAIDREKLSGTMMRDLILKASITNFYQSMKGVEDLIIYYNHKNINYLKILDEEHNYALDKYLIQANNLS